MSENISTVVFDVGNVLIEWDPEHLYRKLIPNEDERQTFLNTVCTMEWNIGQDLGRSWADGIAGLSALRPDKADLIAAYSERWQEMVPGEVPGTPEILANLRASGVPLYAITNFSVEKFAETRERFAFLKTSFIDIVVSGEEQVIKPDLKIYQILLERNGLEAGECLFIDDSQKNVEAARAAGMRAHHFKNAGLLLEELKELNLA